MRDLPDSHSHYISEIFSSFSREFKAAVECIESQGGIPYAQRQNLALTIKDYERQNPLASFAATYSGTPDNPFFMFLSDNIDTNSRPIGAKGFVNLKRLYVFSREQSIVSSVVNQPVFYAHAHIYDRWVERIASKRKYGFRDQDRPYRNNDYVVSNIFAHLMLFALETVPALKERLTPIPIMLPMYDAGLLLGEARLKISQHSSGEWMTFRAHDGVRVFNETSLPQDRWEPKHELYMYTVVDRDLFARSQRDVHDGMMEIVRGHKQALMDTYHAYMNSQIGARNGVPYYTNLYKDPMKNYVIMRAVRAMAELMISDAWKICAQEMRHQAGTKKLFVPGSRSAHP